MSIVKCANFVYIISEIEVHLFLYLIVSLAIPFTFSKIYEIWLTHPLKSIQSRMD